MEEGFDTGAIVAPEAVPAYPDDTAKSLYERLETASLLLVRRVWPAVESVLPVPQQGKGSSARLSELSSLDLAPDELGVLDKLQGARTYGGYGLDFVRDGQSYRARVSIERID